MPARDRVRLRPAALGIAIVAGLDQRAWTSLDDAVNRVALENWTLSDLLDVNGG